MIGFQIHRVVFVNLSSGLKGELNHAKGNRIEVCHAELAALDCFYDMSVVDTLIARHFEVETSLYAVHALVDCAPVADDDTLIAPFAAEYVGENTLILTEIRSVQAVV